MPLITYKRKRFKDATLDVIDQANDILNEYEQQGYDLTLRQLYYQFVSRGLIPNNDREYNRLGSIVNDARLSGLIDWDHITDRTRFLRTVSSWKSPASIMRGAAQGYQRDLWEGQEVHVEVWVEKDALVGVIERACNTLRVPFLSCRGYTSQSEMWSASQRFFDKTNQGRRNVVLHLGDHDPSGIDMSRDIEERILFFMASDHYHQAYREGQTDSSGDASIEFAEQHFNLNRLALNWDQVQQYQPPPNPAKMTDSRGKGYVDKFGRQSWELDALEPTVIGQLIEDAVGELIDWDVWNAAVKVETDERDALLNVSERWEDVTEFLAGEGE